MSTCIWLYINHFPVRCPKAGKCMYTRPASVTIKNQENMFTAEQIKAAHSKVRSGADFPAYIKEIKSLGVTYYETFVTDGHTDYYGANDYKTTSDAKYAALAIADVRSEEHTSEIKSLMRHSYAFFCLTKKSN